VSLRAAAKLKRGSRSRLKRKSSAKRMRQLLRPHSNRRERKVPKKMMKVGTLLKKISRILNLMISKISLHSLKE
jgi:hypothetical protein